MRRWSRLTLLEVLIALGVVGLIAAVLVPTVWRAIVTFFQGFA